MSKVPEVTSAMLNSADRVKLQHENKIAKPKEAGESLSFVRTNSEESEVEIIVTKEKVQDLNSFMQEFIEAQEMDQHSLKKLFSSKRELGPLIFFFRIKTSGQEWTIRRRTYDFQQLHKKIIYELKKAGLVKLADMPALPKIKEQNKELLHDQYLEYIHKLIKNEMVRRKSISFYEFFEMGKVKLDAGVIKYKEGYLKKRGGGRFTENRLVVCCTNLCSRWNIRWFVVCQEGVLYTLGCSHGDIREILLFDSTFDIEVEHGSHKTLTVTAPNRKLFLKTFSVFETIDWLIAFNQARKASPYTSYNRFSSFAPVRQPTAFCKALIDGEQYFGAVCDYLEKAEKEVFITDWWLSPQLYLKRPVSEALNQESRLDRVIQKIADRGVKVHVLVYKEVTLALYNDSFYTKKTLEELHPNIEVQLHPGSYIFMWSHHEKLIIIDQKVGFIGGLDLCYGRMDSNSHSIVDAQWVKDNSSSWWPKIDYYNVRVKDFENVHDFEQELYDRSKIPRMPWHDVCTIVVGDVVKDMSHHFIQYWNHVKTDLVPDDKLTFIQPKVPTGKEDKAIMNDNFAEGRKSFRQRVSSYFSQKKKHKDEDRGKSEHSPLLDSGKSSGKRGSSYILNMSEESKEDTDSKYHKGNQGHQTKEGTSQKVRFAEDPEVVNLEDNNVKRRPQLSVAATNDAGHAHIVTGARSAMLGNNTSYDNQDSAMPKSATKPNGFFRNFGRAFKDAMTPTAKHHPDWKNRGAKSAMIKRRGHHDMQEDFYVQNLLKPNIMSYIGRQEPENIAGTCQCQMLRSSSNWSLGLKEENSEHSIQNAYLELIRESKNFIYIENQFFISRAGGDDTVFNSISDAIIERIKKAAAKKETFRIMIFIPLLPGFAGEIWESKASVLKVQLFWEYATISRGGTSIFETLAKDENIDDPSKYIAFFSLRQHAKLGDVPVSELIYIHSKLMIVDDQKVILGSANINDRSMNGDRDSETAMLIEDTKDVPSKMNGAEYNAKEFALDFRTRLFMEHFGLNYEEALDPSSDDSWQRINDIAKKNTLIYREVFAPYPDDTIANMKDIQDFIQNKHLESYDELSKGIQGHAVQFPIHFLYKEDLNISALSVEYYVPDKNFT